MDGNGKAGEEIIHFYLMARSSSRSSRRTDVIHYGSKNIALMAPSERVSLDAHSTYHCALGLLKLRGLYGVTQQVGNWVWLTLFLAIPMSTPILL